MFFQSINTMMAAGTDLSINIRKVGEQLVVATLPRNNNLKDEARSYFTPLTVTGTPMELDAGFLQAILQPIQKASGLLINLEQFEKQAAATASKAKTEKPKADNEANEPKEKRENYDKCLKKADELTADKRYSEALTYLKQAKTYATPMQQADLTKKIKLVEKEQAQGSLFGIEAVPEMNPVSQQSLVQQQIIQPVQQPQQAAQPMQQQPMQQSIPAQHTIPVPQQPEQGAFQQQQAGYYQPTVQQPMRQPHPQSQPMQQPVIHPAQFAVSGSGQPLPQPPQQKPAPAPQQQPLMQPTYNPAPWSENEEDSDNTDFRQDPYAGYPDFPQEYRMRDEAQLAAVY